MQELSLWLADSELHSLACFDYVQVLSEDLVAGGRTHVLYGGSAQEPARQVPLAVCRDQAWAAQVVKALYNALGRGDSVCDLREALRQPTPEEVDALTARRAPAVVKKSKVAEAGTRVTAGGREKTPAQRAQEAVAVGPLPPQEFQPPRGGASAVQAPQESKG
jgi:hypothetical protein